MSPDEGTSNTNHNIIRSTSTPSTTRQFPSYRLINQVGQMQLPVHHSTSPKQELGPELQTTIRCNVNQQRNQINRREEAIKCQLDINNDNNNSKRAYYQDQFNKLKERLFRNLSKVPIQVESLERPISEELTDQSQRVLVTQSSSSSCSSSSNSSSNSSGSKSTSSRFNEWRPLLIKYYQERAASEVLNLHFGCSLMSHNCKFGLDTSDSSSMELALYIESILKATTTTPTTHYVNQTNIPKQHQQMSFPETKQRHQPKQAQTAPSPLYRSACEWRQPNNKKHQNNLKQAQQEQQDTSNHLHSNYNNNNNSINEPQMNQQQLVIGHSNGSSNSSLSSNGSVYVFATSERDDLIRMQNNAQPRECNVAAMNPSLEVSLKQPDYVYGRSLDKSLEEQRPKEDAWAQSVHVMTHLKRQNNEMSRLQLIDIGANSSPMILQDEPQQQQQLDQLQLGANHQHQYNSISSQLSYGKPPEPEVAELEAAHQTAGHFVIPSQHEHHQLTATQMNLETLNQQQYHEPSQCQFVCLEPLGNNNNTHEQLVDSRGLNLISCSTYEPEASRFLHQDDTTSCPGSEMLALSTSSTTQHQNQTNNTQNPTTPTPTYNQLNLNTGSVHLLDSKLYSRIINDNTMGVDTINSPQNNSLNEPPSRQVHSSTTTYHHSSQLTPNGYFGDPGYARYWPPNCQQLNFEAQQQHQAHVSMANNQVIMSPHSIDPQNSAIMSEASSFGASTSNLVIENHHHQHQQNQHQGVEANQHPDQTTRLTPQVSNEPVTSLDHCSQQTIHELGNHFHGPGNGLLRATQQLEHHANGGIQFYLASTNQHHQSSSYMT